MNRRLTGILAWCALGAIIAIPSTDIILQNAGDLAADRADRVGVASQEKTARPTIDLSANDLSSVLQPAMDDTAETNAAETKLAEVEAPEPKAAPLPEIVPLSPAIQEDATDKRPATVEVADLPQAEILPVAPLDGLEGDVAEAPEAVKAESVAVEISEEELRVEDLEVAALPLQETLIVEEPEFVAPPQPMPAHSRPQPVEVATAPEPEQLRPLPELDDRVRSSVNVIETSRRPQLQFEEPVNEPFWGDNPAYRNGQRLDSFRSEEIVRSDDASDSQFYELWAAENRPAGFRRRGSFSQQLPARRGSAVRLDLLQNN